MVAAPLFEQGIPLIMSIPPHFNSIIILDSGLYSLRIIEAQASATCRKSPLT